MMNISVIIPNYNGKDLLEKNLPKVIENCQQNEIIVVDDASTDDSRSFLVNNYPRIKLITKKENTGFSSSVNLGVKHARGDLIVLLNSDVYPNKGFMDTVLPHFEDSKVFAVGLLQESIENGKIVLRGRGMGEFKHGFLIHKRGEVDRNNTLWVSGGAGVFRKSIWKTLGGLNELYDPFYWEDIDLSYRALKADYKIIFEPKSIVVHKQVRSSIRSKYSKREVKTIAYRNQFFFIWINISDYEFLIEHITWLPVHLVKSIISADFEFISGLVTAIAELPQILTSRKNYQKFWSIKDKHLFRLFMVK